MHSRKPAGIAVEVWAVLWAFLLLPSIKYSAIPRVIWQNTRLGKMGFRTRGINNEVSKFSGILRVHRRA